MSPKGIAVEGNEDGLAKCSGDQLQFDIRFLTRDGLMIEEDAILNL
jgi:hypothetical protein